MAVIFKTEISQVRRTHINKLSQIRDAAVLRHLRAAGLHLSGLGRGGRPGEGHAAQGEAKAPLLQQGTLRVTSDQNILRDKMNFRVGFVVCFL